MGFKKRRLAHSTQSRQQTATAPDSEPPSSNALTLEELKVLQEFRAVGKRGINGDATIESSHPPPKEAESELNNKQAEVKDDQPPTPPVVSDVINAAPVSRNPAHATQTWKPILEEVKL